MFLKDPTDVMTYMYGDNIVTTNGKIVGSALSGLNSLKMPHIHWRKQMSASVVEKLLSLNDHANTEKLIIVLEFCLTTCIVLSTIVPVLALITEFFEIHAVHLSVHIHMELGIETQ